MGWLDQETKALERQLLEGQITRKKYKSELAWLQRDAQAQQDRRDIIDAGRGHVQ